MKFKTKSTEGRVNRRAVTKHLLPQKVGQFLTSWATVSSSSRTSP